MPGVEVLETLAREGFDISCYQSLYIASDRAMDLFGEDAGLYVRKEARKAVTYHIKALVRPLLLEDSWARFRDLSADNRYANCDNEVAANVREELQRIGHHTRSYTKRSLCSRCRRLIAAIDKLESGQRRSQHLMLKSLAQRALSIVEHAPE